MAEPITAIVAGYVVANAPQWLGSAIVDRGAEKAVDKGQEWLSEAKQQRRLEQVLKKAVQRGLKKFHQRKDRDQYRDILANLLESREQSITMLREAITLFTLSDKPDLNELNEIYNRSLRMRNLSQTTAPEPVNAAPYLASFFDALMVELYSDASFKSQISDVIRTRAAMLVSRQISETNSTLHKIHEALKNEYTGEQFQQDLAKYIDHVERAMHNLKIVGFLPKEQKRDPEIHGIFVPLRVALYDHPISNEQSTSIVELLEQHPYMVMLGDPGSGKSTAVRYLAWSHAKVHQSSTELANVPLLSNHPLPVRIELRLFMQSRKNHPYSFLSYATEVLLGKNGIQINSRMFENLLMQQRMLVLFDGLDEVTTLDERRQLVEDIEHFVRLYPGNSVLVTSRPVGYDLARCSNNLFAHSKVQSFDDDQIHQFLERWYTHVLGLSPLQYEDQQELETLFKTLKENPRLHKLAENPLLLTVITGLYRSQRLPEKRVQVYDRCAELLLETWAKLKGTDERWKDTRLGRDDQFACVAHLGFQLHKRSQEENDDQKSDRSGTDTATDVPERVMLREIEHFISNQKLITEVAEQRKEAKRFLDLMRIEAGLIVERGTDENGESIYGFVHRTFQEYFAACDVYERYQQEENPAVISDFLKKHLHDPHWSEVILLLLGKLKYKPLTNQLSQILDGKIKSDRSCYTDVMQQDLFFVCDCLAEDMPIETKLATTVISRLSSLITTSPFSPQRRQALGIFVRLAQTKQFASLMLKELAMLLAIDAVGNINVKIELAKLFCSSNSLPSEFQGLATRFLLHIMQCSSFSFELISQAAQTLYYSSTIHPEEEQKVLRTLLYLTQCSDLSIRDRIEVVEVLHLPDLNRLEKQQVVQLLLQFIECSNLSIEDRITAAEALYASNYRKTDKKKLKKSFLQIVQDPNISIVKKIEAIDNHYRFDLSGSDKQQIVQFFWQRVRDPGLSIENRIKAAEALLSPIGINRSDERRIIRFLLQSIKDPDLSIENRIKAAEALPGLSDIIRSYQKQQVTQFLLQCIQDPNLPMQDRIKAAEALYSSRFLLPKERQQNAILLWQLIQNEKITTDQRLYVATLPITQWRASYLDKAQAIKILLTLLPVEKIANYIEEKWSDMWRSLITPEELPSVIELVRQKLLPQRIRDEMYSSLQGSIPQFHQVPDSSDSPS